uniref:Sec-independent protein translocase component TatC n=1 Tax=Jakoba bahamiensis TaxID=221721 RepID=M4Q9U0_9EUKA|nr:Sec-independent protein translocase component TatC [Jakoba bahamiensis]AGH24136.1 Sec-independent protein translocase component TatC [Jakoba bahamiensis]
MSSILNQFSTELRFRFYYILLSFVFSTICAYMYKESLIQVLSIIVVSHFIYTTLSEAFFSYVHLSFQIGFVITSPLFFFHIWKFFVPGMYLYEKRVLRFFILFFFFLMILSFFFAYQYFIPNVISFFSSFQEEHLFLQLKISDYLTLVASLYLYLFLIFQIPIFLFVFWKISGFSLQSLGRFRRFIYLFLTILTAILSPPDVLSQILLVIPCLFLYESSILLLHVISKY